MPPLVDERSVHTSLDAVKEVSGENDLSTEEVDKVIDLNINAARSTLISDRFTNTAINTFAVEDSNSALVKEVIDSNSKCISAAISAEFANSTISTFLMNNANNNAIKGILGMRTCACAHVCFLLT